MRSSVVGPRHPLPGAGSSALQQEGEEGEVGGRQVVAGEAVGQRGRPSGAYGWATITGFVEPYGISTKLVRRVAGNSAYFETLAIVSPVRLSVTRSLETGAPGGASLRIDASELRAKSGGADPGSLLTPWRTELWVAFDDVRVFAGPVGSFSHETGSAHVDIECGGLASYFHGVCQEATASTSFAALEQTAIAWQMIADAQARTSWRRRPHRRHLEHVTGPRLHVGVRRHAG